MDTDTITETTPLAAVQALYEAFARGDIAAVVAGTHPEVDWSTQVDAPGAELVPMFRNGIGHDAVLAYFGGVAALEFHAFIPVRFLVDGEHVYVDLELDVEHRETGKRAQLNELHHFVVQDGLVVRYRHYVDTATFIELYRP